MVSQLSEMRDHLLITVLTAWNTDPPGTQFCFKSRIIVNNSQRDKLVSIDQYELALGALHSLKPGEKPIISLVVRIYSIIDVRPGNE
jgi:P2-related tail formation protein